MPHLRYILPTLALCAAGIPLAAEDEATLLRRAVLPAVTIAPCPQSGGQLGTTPINGVVPPFAGQPVQGFSAIHRRGDGTFDAMCDNGFGSLENSADFHLRVYRIKPQFETAAGGPGTMSVLNWIELHDPDRRIPFAITNHFTAQRTLTGADFDIESMQRAADGTLWFGDEFGPFLLHTDANGKVLEAPIALPDLEQPGRALRSPQNPLHEETAAVRVMNAMRTHARRLGSPTPVFSPYHVMLVDGNPAVDHYARGLASPTGSGLAPAASDVFDVGQMQRAGYPVVCWTVNDSARMTELLRLRLNGIISDRPDLLYQAVAAFDANGDGTPGDYLLPDGRIDSAKCDAQGHRGARNLRPENTLPGMEAALDHLMTTLELDCGVTRDGWAVLDHDPILSGQKARRADGLPFGPADAVPLKSLTLAEIQERYIADLVFRGPTQQNDPALSPVTMAYRAAGGIRHEYTMPSLWQVFAFVRFYEDYYRTGAGQTHPQAAVRAANAAQVRFNVETKTNPRAEFADRTDAPWVFTLAVGLPITFSGLSSRADIQSFDFRELLLAHWIFPRIRTVCLMGDFPIYADRSQPDSDDGTNLQDEAGANTPWLAGLPWPYRTTQLTHPFRVQRSGGFEGMAISPNRTALYPLLEKPIIGGAPDALLLHRFDLRTRSFTGEQWRYPLDPRATAIGDFVLFDRDQGLVIERDDTQGRLDGFKRIMEVRLGAPGTVVQKASAVDLLRIADPAGISLPARPGDVGLGAVFAFPFVTIEDVFVIDRNRIGVLNDNNFPFSTGRNPTLPDDNEFVILRLHQPLGSRTAPSATN